jgi:hypothetical protein
MSNVFDIHGGAAYGVGMFRTRMHSMVTGINRFWDLLPEPLVLRAMQAPERTPRAYR